MRVHFFPEFLAASDLSDCLARSAWYFAPYADDNVSFALRCTADIFSKARLPEYLDPAINEAFGRFIAASEVSPNTVADRDFLGAIDKDRDVLLLWDKTAEHRIADIIPKMRETGRFFEVDRALTRNEGSFYLWAGLNSFSDARRLARESYKKFECMMTDIGHHKVSYVFGTGPTLSEFCRTHDFSDGLCIVANSIVKNDSLLEKLRPKIIAAGDPIFHAGVSQYAAEFRKHLTKAMRKTGAWFVCPLRDYNIYLNSLPPDLRDRIVGVPFDRSLPASTNLLQRFHAYPYANILTLLLLPLGSTFSDEIRIVGCDGRPIEQNQYFWQHDKSAQFNDEMNNIKSVHPAFFNISYDDYYSEHCENIETWINALEDSGRTVYTMTPSYVPALKTRFINESAIVVTIDPDAEGQFGHYIHYDRQLSSAFRQRKIPVVLAGRKTLDSNIESNDFKAVIRTFTINSYTIDNKGLNPSEQALGKFAEELEDALSQIEERWPDKEIFIYMYCGGIHSSKMIFDAARRRNNVRAVVNLFWTFALDENDPSFKRDWQAPLLAMHASPYIRLTVQTSTQADDLERVLGVRLDVAPHTSTTFSDHEALARLKSTPQPLRTPPRILFPGGMLKDKGFLLSSEVARALHSNRKHEVLVRTISNAPPDAEIAQEVAALRDFGLQLSDQSLSEEQFIELLCWGDVIVCPYLPRSFRRRTSGLVVDALILGKPVVVVEGTWLADIVRELGFGEVAEATPEALCNAVSKIIADYKLYQDNIQMARQIYIEKNTWAALSQSICPSQESLAKELSSDFPRTRKAHVDETGVVAHMLSARKGPDHVMLDVGAHFGTSAGYFHKLGWTIHCFEPDPKNREKLMAKFGNAENVRIDPRAVSDKRATGVSFFSSKESTGISGLSAFHKTHEESARVDVTTVADIIRDRGILHVDFLKIDVEGFDFGVLKGVPWDRLKPDVVECEFEDAKTVPLGHTWKDIADFLCGHGYHVYVSEWHPIIRYGIPHDWRRVYKYPGPPIDDSAWGNFLAFREDPGLPAIKAAFDALIRYRPVVTARPQPDKTLSSPIGAIDAKAAPNLKDSAGGAANLNPATAGIPVAAQQTTNDDRVNMLKKTPPNALEAAPPARMWYAEPAERLRQASPQLFTLLQFARRSFVHVISRPHLLVLLLAVVAGASWVSLDTQFAANRGWLLAGGGFALVTLGLVYIAAKAQAHAATLHVRAANLERELFALKDTAARTQQLVTLNSHSRADAISARIAQLQSELALARAANAKLTSDFSKLTGDLNKLSASATAAQTLKADVEKLAGATAALPQLQAEVISLTAALPQLRGEVTNLSAALPQLQAEVTNLSAAVQAIPQSLEPKIQESKDAAHKLTSELAARIADLAKQVEAGTTTDASLQISIQDIQASVKALQDQRAGIETAVANASAKVQSAEDRLATTEKWSRFDNAAWFQHFNRKLSRQHVETLDKEWRKRLSIPMQPATLGYMANRACEIERQLEGRLATSIEDILLRALVARAVKGKSVDVLEIGTLFGTGAAIMFDALEGHYEQIHFTLLDPLEGYYNGAQADILTGQRVNEHVVRKNFARVGMGEDQYTLIKHLSTEPEAMQKAATRKYDVLVIDGDHSYAGVKTDFENYAPLVRVGGYIILDDYNSPDWPDVKEYVDKELDKHDFIAPVGATWRTSVYRVVKDPAKPGRSQNSGARKKSSSRSEVDDTQTSDE